MLPATERLPGSMGYDPAYGTRRLRRVIQKQLIDHLALALLEGGFRERERCSRRCGRRGLVLETVGDVVPPSPANDFSS